jgi:hypothetical protein
MANWCNLQLSVFGPPGQIAAFRKAAGRLKGRVDTTKSSIFLPEMERGESGDLTAYEPKPFARRFQRAEYTFQGRNNDYGDYFRDISDRWHELAFVLTFGDPNADAHGSHLFLAGDQRIWGIPVRLHRQLMRKHFKRRGLINSRGHMDYDADDSDRAEWDAYFEMMDIAAAHWDRKVVAWLRDCHPRV